jgi:hypothetical protein
MTKERSVYNFALSAGLIAAAISWFEIAFPYLPDSDNYIEQARSFMARGVFEATPFSMEQADTVFAPDYKFPPGYPLLIVISSLLFQQPAEVVAPYLSLAALLLLPISIVFSFHRIIGLWPSFWIGVFVAFTPAAIKLGYFAYSDLISLLLVIFSVNRLLMLDNKAGSWFCLGLLTGYSYLIRNANIALLIGIALYLLWHLIVEAENRKLKIYNIGFWLSGNAVSLVPMFVYNLMIFGKTQPYSMPPSKIGLSENIHDYIFSQLNTLLAVDDLGHLLADNTAGIIALICMMAVLLHQIATTWQQWQKIEQQTFLISIAYIAIGAAVTVVARTKYEWGVHIVDRYALPYSCFIFVSLTIIFKNATPKINTRHLIPGLVVALLLVRIGGIQKLHATLHDGPYSVELQAAMSAADGLKNNPDTICKNSNGRFAMSNIDYVYRVVCAVPVRRAYPSFQHNVFIDESLKTWADFGAKKGIVVSLFPFGKQRDNLPLKQDDLVKLNALGWQVERNEKENLILSHEAASL